MFEMDCMIHKYAKTLGDIERLEGVIGLQKVLTSRQYQDKLIRDQGAFSMALKFMDALGVDEAVRISGFSKEELLSGELGK